MKSPLSKCSYASAKGYPNPSINLVDNHTQPTKQSSGVLVTPLASLIIREVKGLLEVDFNINFSGLVENKLKWKK